MALGTCVVIKVMRACNLDATRSEFAVNKIIGNDRNLTVAKWQINQLANQVLVTRIFRMYSECAVRHHGLGPRGSDGHAALFHAVNELWAIGKGIANVVHLPVALGAFDL